MAGLGIDLDTAFGQIGKKPERKRKNLIRLGVPYGTAYAFSRTRKGGWAIAQSPILGTTITLARLRKRGYVSMYDWYEKVTTKVPMFNEPPYMVVSTGVRNYRAKLSYVRWCERCNTLEFSSVSTYSISGCPSVQPKPCHYEFI
jgi:hypothetical protein